MSPIPSGRAILDSERLLREAGLSLDMSYADLGAGMLGHFVLPASQIVGPAGTVYAVDILKSALQSIESRVQLKGVINLQTVWGDIERPGGVNISSGSLDLVSLVDVAHVLLKTTVPMEETKRLLRPGGRVLIVDWDPNAGTLLVAKEHRVSVDQVKNQFVQGGFRLTQEFVAGPQHWGLVFKRP